VSRPEPTVARRLLGVVAPPLLLAAPLVVCHLLGWREHTSVLSGTVPGAGAALAGLVYVAAWLAAVLAAPILLLGGAFAWAMEGALAAAGRRRPPASR